MKRVIGFGGVFFKAEKPEELAEWYRKHLGFDVQDWGGVTFREGATADLEPRREAYITWSPFEAGTEYFAPSTKGFMLNFRVQDLDQVLAELRREGVAVEEKTESSEFGKFSWLMDPEGTKIELWEPPLAQ